MVNGLTDLALTKLDVLSGRETIQIAVAYERDGQRLETPPATGLSGVKPIFEELEGWTEDIGTARSLDDLPAAARRYVLRVEELSGCKVSLIGVGPARAETIEVADPFES